MAVKKECRETVEDLLQHGANVNISDEDGGTPLHFTALGENGEFFGFHPGKDPDITVRGEIAKLLLIWGSNVNAETEDGLTTLHAAAKNGYVKVVEFLMEYNADVNCRVKHIGFTGIDSEDGYGRTALHIAAENDRVEVVEFLLKFGASIDFKVEYGRTAITICLWPTITSNVKCCSTIFNFKINASTKF
jgi:ankyrin repeat protein